jgi:hypothetical protein
MDLNFEGPPTRGLRCYVQLVADLLRLGDGGYSIQLDEPASVYLPFDDKLPAFPTEDVALTWDYRHGWAAGIEIDGGKALIVLSYLGVDILPCPRLVERFVRQLFDERFPGQPDPPDLDNSGLLERLTGYAHPAVT